MDFDPTIEIKTFQKKRKREVSIKGASLEQMVDELLRTAEAKPHKSRSETLSLIIGLKDKSS